MKAIVKTAVIQSEQQPLNITQPASTIAGQIINIFERNKLTIAQSKQILIDVENALNSQSVHSNTQCGVFSEFPPQTIGIIDYTIMC